MVHHAGYLDHTNSLFLKSGILKFRDLVNFKTGLILFKACKKWLPGNIQLMFMVREGTYNLRGNYNFKLPTIHSTLKSICISVCGVKLWNKIDEEIKMCMNSKQFKHKYKKSKRVSTLNCCLARLHKQQS